MQSLWNDIVVVLDAQCVRIQLRPRGGVRQIFNPDIVALHGGSPAEVIASVLDQQPRCAPYFRNRLHVVVGSPWAYTLVLPWQKGLFSDAAWDSYARALFATRTNCADWKIGIEEGAYGDARLSAAICPDLLAALSDVCAATGWRLASVRDQLSTLLWKNSAAIAESVWCLLLAEPETVTCLYHDKQGWQDVVTLPRTQYGVEAWIAMGSLLAKQPTQQYVYVCGADLPVDANSLGGVQVLDNWNSSQTAPQIPEEGL